jgi:hypothetical protein
MNKYGYSGLRGFVKDDPILNIAFLIGAGHTRLFAETDRRKPPGPWITPQENQNRKPSTTSPES